MKKANLIFFLGAFLIFGNLCYAQNVVVPYEVGTWQGFRSAAITFTFDDGSPNQYAIAIPMFNEYGFNLTLFIVTSPSWGWPANWTALQNAASQGHEIASHTVTHTSFSGMSDAQQTIELEKSQNDINAHVTAQKCLTMAYPYIAVGNRALCSQYYIAARGGAGYVEPRTPGDFMNISSIVCGPEGPIKTSQHFIGWAKSAANSKGWCVLMFHGIDNDGGWSSVPSDTLRADLEYLKANPDKYWVSTFANVALYIKERNAVSVAELSSQDSSITLQVTDNLPDSLYNYPITLRRPLPVNWPAARVSQNNQPVAAQFVEINSTKYIMFDVVPDGGEIVLSSSTPSGVQFQGSLMPIVPALAQNYPNPFNLSTAIPFSLPVVNNVRIVLVNILGEVVKEIANGRYEAGSHQVVLDASNLATGVYFYKLEADGLVNVKKLALIK